jgi:hypothetical protein
MLKKHEFFNVLEFIMISLNISMNDIFIFMDINTMFIILQHQILNELEQIYHNKSGQPLSECEPIIWTSEFIDS